MSDDARRRAERSAARGDPDATVKLLAERLRAGAITSERLELAAYVGDVAARAVLGARAEKGARDVGRFLRGLGRFDRVIADHAIAALAGLALGSPDDWPELHAWRVEAAELTRGSFEADRQVRPEELRELATHYRWHGQDEAMSLGALVADALRAFGTESALEAAVRLGRSLAKRSGEESVRDALRTHLTEWALA